MISRTYNPEPFIFHVNGMECLIDLDEAQRLFGRSIYLRGRYLSISIGQSYCQLHRYILGMDPSDPHLVDHINGNPLDNRRENIRRATKSQNGMNTRTKTGSSGVRGVNWCKQKNRWVAHIMVKSKRYKLGAFMDLADAAEARQAAEEIFFAEFAAKNGCMKAAA